MRVVTRGVRLDVNSPTLMNAADDSQRWRMGSKPQEDATTVLYFHLGSTSVICISAQHLFAALRTPVDDYRVSQTVGYTECKWVCITETLPETKPLMILLWYELMPSEKAAAHESSSSKDNRGRRRDPVGGWSAFRVHARRRRDCSRFGGNGNRPRRVLSATPYFFV